MKAEKKKSKSVTRQIYVLLFLTILMILLGLCAAPPGLIERNRSERIFQQQYVELQAALSELARLALILHIDSRESLNESAPKEAREIMDVLALNSRYSMKAQLARMKTVVAEESALGTPRLTERLEGRLNAFWEESDSPSRLELLLLQIEVSRKFAVRASELRTEAPDRLLMLPPRALTGLLIALFIATAWAAARILRTSRQTLVDLDQTLEMHKSDLAALAASERRIKLLIESSPYCIHQIDRERRLVSINQTGLRMLGQTEENAVVGKPYLDYVSQKERPRIQALMDEAFAGKPVVFEFRSSGRTCFKSNFIPLSESSEDVHALLGMTEDITAAKEAADRLAASEEQLRLVIQAAQDGIWDVNLETGTVMTNQTFESLFGSIPKTVEEAWTWREERINEPERAEVVSSLQLAIEDASVTHWEKDYHFRGLGQAEHFVQDRALITRDAAGKAIRIVGSMRDQSALEKAMLEREELERKFQETQKLESLGVLAGGIAHDFNNLLTAMLGNVSLVKLEVSSGFPLLPMLSDIEDAALRAAELCKQMLAYAGRSQFAFSHCDLNSVIRENVQLLQISIGKSARLQLRLADALPPILADVSQIHQIVMNLVINASEAIGDRDGVIRLTTDTLDIDEPGLEESGFSESLAPGSYVYFEVSDSGCGMDQATREKIFDPFFTTKFTGRGLGLSAVMGIVRGHKGAIRIHSEPGEGTTFKILFPAALDALPEPDDGQKESISAGAGEFHGTALIIDDEEYVLRMVKRALEGQGFDTLTSKGAKDGLNLFRQHHHNLKVVLLDLTMPHMNGVDVFRQIRQLNQETPIILMSGYNEKRATAQFVGKGLAGFIQKPFVVDDLIETLRQALRSA